MSVELETARVSYNGAGSTGPFDIPFYFLANSHILAVKRDTDGTESTLTLTTDYTLTGAGDEDGGQLTLVVALASGETLTITRNVPITQETNWPTADPFPAASHERAMDKLTMIAQQVNDRVGRTLRQPVSDTTAIGELPIASLRANQALTFDADGNPLMADISGDVIAFTPTTEAFNGTGAQTAYTLSGAPSTASALIVRIDGVVQTPITDYTVSGTTLTFTTAPASGSGNIVVQNFGIAREASTVGVDNVVGLSASTGASKVGFLQSGSGAIDSTVQAYLRKIRIVHGWIPVALWDGIAAGTNTTALTTYIQNALNDGGTHNDLYMPKGTYKIDGTIALPTGTKLIGAGEQATVINQTVDATALRCDQATETSARYLVLEDFKVLLSGVSASATTYGINIVGTSANSAYNRISRVAIAGGFYNDFRIVKPIVTSLSDCVSVDAANDGFALVGNGTSIKLQRCYSNAATRYGFSFIGALSYSGLETCACDTAGSHGYYFAASTVGGSDWPVSIDLQGCGSESNTGDGYHIVDAEDFVFTACRSLSNTGDGAQIDGARGVVMNALRATGNGGWGVNPSTSATPKIPSAIVLIGCTLSGNSSGRVSTPSRVTEIASTDSNVFQSPVSLHAQSQTAIPAGGTAGAGFLLSTTANFGIFFGSSAPTLAAAKGSLYLRTDGSGTTTRAYINTDGSTTWTNITTAA